MKTRCLSVVLCSLGAASLSAQTRLVVPKSLENLPAQLDAKGVRPKMIGDFYYRDRGVFGLSKANAEQAVGWYAEAVAKGSSDAAIALHNMYSSGDGVPKDRAIALYWLDRAAVAGHAQAADALRRMDIAIGSMQAPPPSQGPDPDPAKGTAPVSPGSMTLEGQIARLCDQISQEMSAANKPSIAVVAFSNLDGQTSELGKYLAEEITTTLFQTKRFKVIERHMLDKVLKEQKLQGSGLIDEESARQLGKLLGVTAIVSGTVTELESTVKLNARLIGTETGEIFGAAAAALPKTSSIQRLLATRAGETGLPAAPRASGESPSSGPSVQVGSLSYSLVGCVRQPNGFVELTLKTLNQAPEKEFSFYRGALYLYTEDGGKYRPDSLRIGNKEGAVVSTTLFPGSPITIRATFKEIPLEFRHAVAIEVFDPKAHLKGVPIR